MKSSYDHPGMYAIHIAGRLEPTRMDMLSDLKIVYSFEEGADGPHPLTIIEGTLPDQAALLGILNALYNNRYPLLFVKYLCPA